MNGPPFTHCMFVVFHHFERSLLISRTEDGKTSSISFWVLPKDVLVLEIIYTLFLVILSDRCVYNVYHILLYIICTCIIVYIYIHYIHIIFKLEQLPKIVTQQLVYIDVFL